jgi:hypothetical protein
MMMNKFTNKSVMKRQSHRMLYDKHLDDDDGLLFYVKKKKDIIHKLRIRHIEESFIKASIKWWNEYRQMMECELNKLEMNKEYQYVKSRWQGVSIVYNYLVLAENELKSRYKKLEEDEVFVNELFV